MRSMIAAISCPPPFRVEGVQGSAGRLSPALEHHPRPGKGAQQWPPVASKARTRDAAAFAGLAFLSATIACGTPSPQTQPAPAAITFTLTNADCASAGVGAVLQSQFAAEVVNSTSSRAQFNLQRLMDGRTYRELEQEIQARQHAISAGASLTPTVPSMSIHVTGSGFVEAGQRGRIEGTLSSGEYGLVCRSDSPTGTIEAIYVRGPFRVG
jgi:hypothetical protein